MCETAKERYQNELSIFEASLHRGRPTKLSEVCRDNKVYYRGMLKWLYQTDRTMADIRKGSIIFLSHPARQDPPCLYFSAKGRAALSPSTENSAGILKLLDS